MVPISSRTCPFIPDKLKTVKQNFWSIFKLISSNHQCHSGLRIFISPNKEKYQMTSLWEFQMLELRRQHWPLPFRTHLNSFHHKLHDHTVLIKFYSFLLIKFQLHCKILRIRRLLLFHLVHSSIHLSFLVFEKHTLRAQV